MRRGATLCLRWAGWFVAMTVIGLAAYQIGGQGNRSAFSGNALWAITRNSMIAATFLSLLPLVLMHGRKSQR